MSEPTYVDFTVTKGQTLAARFSVTDGSNSHVSIVGAKVLFRIAQDLDDPDDESILLINSVDDSDNFDMTAALTGVFDIHLTTTQTNLLTPSIKYAWTYKIILADGTTDFPNQGKINVVRGGISAV